MLFLLIKVQASVILLEDSIEMTGLDIIEAIVEDAIYLFLQQDYNIITPCGDNSGDYLRKIETVI